MYESNHSQHPDSPALQAKCRRINLSILCVILLLVLAWVLTSGIFDSSNSDAWMYTLMIYAPICVFLEVVRDYLVGSLQARILSLDSQYRTEAKTDWIIEQMANESDSDA